ncbi:MAG TPA: ABC transporter permease subunit [Stellaceae bacterium]|nr:ABC transporter permease subunit [Stellaceae bacterium]
MSARGRGGHWGRRGLIGIPYLWLVLFTLLPLAIVLKISFAESRLAIPPYGPLFETGDGGLRLGATLESYARLLSDSLYIRAYLSSIRYALAATLISLLLGYPMAYAIARAPKAWRVALLMLVILPFWTSFLLRVYAWIGLLKGNGLVNNVLIALGVVSEPLPLLNNSFSVVLGLVYGYLPFMVLPLYATLERLDPALLEAAADLGCRPWRAFLRVTLPLSLPGIVAGSLLVFIPAIGEFVIPELLGGPGTLMVGKVLWDEFFNNHDWPVASAVAVAMLLLLALPMATMRRFLREEAR